MSEETTVLEHDHEGVIITVTDTLGRTLSRNKLRAGEYAIIAQKPAFAHTVLSYALNDGTVTSLVEVSGVPFDEEAPDLTTGARSRRIRGGDGK